MSYSAKTVEPDIFAIVWAVCSAPMSIKPHPISTPIWVSPSFEKVFFEMENIKMDIKMIFKRQAIQVLFYVFGSVLSSQSFLLTING